MQKHKLFYLFLFAAALSYSSFALAALNFLPRFQGSNPSGRGKVPVTCASKGGVEKGANQTCTGPFSAGGKVCYKSCVCDTSKFSYTIASHQGSGKLCASLSNACSDSKGTRYSTCNLNTCNARNSSWIGENSKSSYTGNNYTCSSQGVAGKDGTCYVCACPSSWATGSCPANASSCSTCKAVSPYNVAKFNLVSCKSGYYKNGNTCTQCPAGSYCNGTGKNTCPAGSYSAAGASSCSQCSAGQYSSAGASSCSTCRGGTYSVAGSSSCTECSAGTYSAAGASSCSSCSDGKYSTKGSSSCISCAPKKSNSTHTGCVDCTSNADCTKVSGGTCSNSTCKYPVITCNSSSDRSSEKAACPASLMGYQCTSCTAQAADGSQTAGQYNCSCAARSIYPHGSAGSGTNGYLMTGANYGIDTVCDGWHIVCPNSKCKAGYYYTGGGCLACTGNTYSAAKATSCTTCASGTVANSNHTGCDKVCTETCAGYTKVPTTGNTITRCFVGQTRETCTDCDGVEYYKCTGEATILPDPIEPVDQCPSNQKLYQGYSEKAKNMINRAYNCGNYTTWGSGMPISRDDTCLIFMRRWAKTIDDHNEACPNNKVDNNFNSMKCNTCCEGSGDRLGLLSACIAGEDDSGMIIR